MLNELLLTPDEKVRLAAVQVFGNLSYVLLLSRIPIEVLMSLGERCKDRRGVVRTQAMRVLARMWDLAYSDMFAPFKTRLMSRASGQTAAMETFSWIPSALVSTMYSDLPTTLYKMLFAILTPLTMTDDMLRTRRLMLFTSQLDTRSEKAFLACPHRQAQAGRLFLTYIDFAEKYNGGVVESDPEEADKKLDQACLNVAKTLVEPENVQHLKADLKKWAQGNDRRGFKLFRDLLDPEKDSKAWRKAEVIRFVSLLILERGPATD